MLKQKETKSEEVMTFKLSTGEEIIGIWMGVNTDDILVKRPLALVLAEMPGAPQQTQVVFTPWMLAMGDDQVAHIGNRHVISKSPAKKDAREQYLAATRD